MELATPGTPTSRLTAAHAGCLRKIALTRKNALFAGHEVGAENWALLASLIANCKMCDVDPVSYLSNTLRALLDGHPRSRIDDLMPWNFAVASSRAA